MLVKREEFDEVVARLAETPVLAVDTETSGLRPYHDDQLFSVIFADASREYYFNFNRQHKDERLPQGWVKRLQPIFSTPGVLVGHNLKFDLHFLSKEGLTFSREFWCTQAMARVEFNAHMRYSLADCAERIGLKKDDKVKAWLDENKAFTILEFDGKKKREKKYHFERAPLDLILPYACQDARVAFRIMEHQRAQFAAHDESGGGAPISAPLVRNEQAITAAFFRMESHGIKIDREYCAEALAYELRRVEESKNEFKRLTGVDFVDSAVSLKAPLIAAGVTLGKTEKGNDSLTASVLEGQASNPVVQAVLAYRDAHKRAGTYWSSFLSFADARDRVHTNLRQSGTASGRTSSSDPNLQNVTADDESPYPVRRAFTPDAEDSILVSIDYTQCEYYLLLDYAREMGVVQQVLAGMDLHDACAKLMGVTRREAKTINFALLYGAGVDKLAATLGCSREKAQELKGIYFRALPGVKSFIKNVITTAERRGYVWNWFGRRSYFANGEFSYTAPNYIIQGGVGDMKKLAVVKVDKLLQGRKSRLSLEIHDELLLNIKRDELQLIPTIVGVMEQAYPAKVLPMKCSVAWSDRSWHDLVDGLPVLTEASA